MNERIRKLFDQALAEFTAENKYATVVVPDPVQRDFVEKFAELIIKECVSVCMDHRVGKQDYNTGRLHCSFDIKDHFGVEE